MKSSELMTRLTEAEFQQMIVDRARALGWLVHHDRGDYRQCIAGDPGFPDLVLARAGEVLFAEIKSEKGRVTEAQDRWLNALDPRREGLSFGLPAFVWRPSDWPVIQEVLA